MKKQMYIVTAPCWKCDGIMNVAMISDSGKGNDFCGPEGFTEEEQRIAENNNVVIRKHNSHTRGEFYRANTCPHCNTFIGQHYLFTDYFTAAEYGDYEYKTIALP